MDIQTINNRMGDLTQELSKQFQAEFIRLAETEEGLLGLMHEIAENPDMYFPILGPRTVHLAVAYNEAVNSYMALDEIIHEEWEQSQDVDSSDSSEKPEPPHLIEFPVDPFNLPMDNDVET